MPAAQRFQAFSFWKTDSALAPIMTGLLAWFKADAGLYDATVGGSPVAANGSVKRWEDQSGNGRHATQATTGNAPLRKTAVVSGRDAVRFDSANSQMMTTPSWAQVGAGSLYVVFVLRGGMSPYARIVEVGANNHHCFSMDAGGVKGRISIADNFNFADTTFNLATGTNYLFTGLGQNGSQIKRVNGTQIGASTNAIQGTTGSVPITLGNYGGGSGYYLNGDLCEVLWYNSHHNTTDRALVEAYLTARWP